MTCQHTRRIKRKWDGVREEWRCESCGALSEPEKRWKPGDGAPYIVGLHRTEDPDSLKEPLRDSRWPKEWSGERCEREVYRSVEEIRKVRDEGRLHPEVKSMGRIPGELFFGKMRETGDRNYWDDPKNRNRHSTWRVDNKRR